VKNVINGGAEASGGWRLHETEVVRLKMGSPVVGREAAGDRGLIVATKRHNGRGARGAREMET
jgi:hypothetical protein